MKEYGRVGENGNYEERRWPPAERMLTAKKNSIKRRRQQPGQEMNYCVYDCHYILFQEEEELAVRVQKVEAPLSCPFFPSPGMKWAAFGYPGRGS